MEDGVKSGKGGNEMQLVKVDDSWLNKIEVPRESEVVGGFQRKLSHHRVRAIVKYMSNGHELPPIILGKIEDRYVCIDGQHRLEARKIKPFNLYAVVQDTDARTAVDEFETMNTMSAKVPLSHRLKVSNAPLVKYFRHCADSHRIDIKQVYALAKGVTGKWSIMTELREGISTDDKHRIDEILEVWTHDRRWKSKSSVFSRSGTLTVVGQICRNRKRLKKTLEMMLKLDYSKPSALYEHYGSGGSSLKYMKEYIIRKLFNGMDE